MCDSTQGSLCPSPCNTSMYVDTVINFAKYHIHTHTTYILHTYYVHTTYRMSDHIVSYWTQFRRDKKDLVYKQLHVWCTSPAFIWLQLNLSLENLNNILLSSWYWYQSHPNQERSTVVIVIILIIIMKMSMWVHTNILTSGGGGTDLERGYGDVRPWRPPFHVSPAVRKGPISSKSIRSQGPLLRKFGNFSFYSLNFH